jgi:integrase
MPRERKGAVITRGKIIYARVRYVDDFGKTKSIERKAENRTNAKLILKDLLRELDERGEKGIEAQSLTFKQLAEDYKSRKLIPAEYHGNGKNITKIAGLRSWKTPQGWLNTLIDHFGNKKIRSITHADIEDYKFKRLNKITVRETQRAIASVNRELELLRAILRFAVRQRWLSHSPFELGEPLISKSDEIKRERVLNFDEEKRLLNVCSGERTITYKRKGKEVTAKMQSGRELLKALIITAIDTAMRKGEIIKLRWQDVDFSMRTITIIALNSKTAKARQVGMTHRVFDELKNLWEQSPKDVNELVFGIKDNFKKSFASACADAEIEGFRFHDLRHTAITRMIQAGLSPVEVMKVSGHTQMTTFARYVNPNTQAITRIADVLAAFHAESISEPTNEVSDFVN